VRLLQADNKLNAMLLERCDPGTVLRNLPELEQDVVIAQLLRRLWRVPSPPHPFRPLSVMTAHWTKETISDASRWPDAGLVREGLDLFEELPRTVPTREPHGIDLRVGGSFIGLYPSGSTRADRPLLCRR
jgi:hypothetical protein